MRRDCMCNRTQAPSAVQDRSLQLHPGNNHNGLEANNTDNSERTDPWSPSSGQKNEQEETDGVFDHFEGNAAHDDSANLLGDVGAVPNTTMKKRVFVGNYSHNKSVQALGSISGEAVGQIMDGRKAEKREGEAADSKAAGGRGST